MKIYYVFLIALTSLVCCKKAEEKKSEPFHPQAASFLDTYELEYKRLNTEANEAAWTLNTRIEEGDTITQSVYEKAAQKLTDFTGSVANIDSAKKYLAIPNELSPLQKRQMEYILFLAGGAPATAAETVKELIKVGAEQTKILYLRLEKDVLSRNPFAVIIFIGVNDVWHKRTHGTGTDADKFESFYTAIIQKLKDRNIKVVLCTPAAIGEKTDNSNELDGDLNHYSNIIRGLAKTNGIPLIDLRQTFLEYNKKVNSENKEAGILTSDRVHLNEKGNQVVAEEMWKSVKTL